MIREAEAKEQSKRVQKELQKRAFEMKQSGAVADKMKSMSSADFAPREDPTSTPTQSSGSR